MTTSTTTVPKPKRKKLPGLNTARTLRLNEFGDIALEQVASFFTEHANHKLSNAILFSIAIGDYRNFLKRRLHVINQLTGEDHKEALEDLVREEMAKVRFIRGRDDM